MYTKKRRFAILAAGLRQVLPGGLRMLDGAAIIEVNEHNLDAFPQAICFINPKNACHSLKTDWLKRRFREGLKIKMLTIPQEQKPVGFIEYVPGAFAWRGIRADYYMVIHCLWINGRKYQHQGLAGLMLEAVEQDARGMLGVAVVTSDKAFMADRRLFLKHGFTRVAESGRDQLLVKQFKEGSVPSISCRPAELEKYQQMTIVYSRQCPWVARFVEEIQPLMKQEELNLHIIEIGTAAEAQNGPSLYGVFHLIHRGRLLADRYISITRFHNILRNERR